MNSPGDKTQLALARVSVKDHNSLRQALHEVTRITADAMQIARISIWMFMPGGESLRCEYLHQPDQPQALEGTLLHRQQFPHYLSALEQQRAVPVADLSDQAILEEFFKPYMLPLGITAMLDAPIYRAGTVIGVVCHEQVGHQREWLPEDTTLAACTADNVARLYEEAARQQAELMLAVHQSHARELDRIALIGQMAAGIAHDFRNILQALMSYADMMASAAPGNDRVRELVERQIQVINMGTKLADGLMSIGRKDNSQACVLDVAATLEGFLPTLHKAVGSQIPVLADLPAGIGQVFMDRNELERVVLNLALNARDAMPQGGTIHIRLYEAHRPIQTGDNALYVTLEVADNGCGMDEQTLRQLFQPYFTTKGDQGTGLGMTVIEQIVTLAGGFVDVDSSPGKGTRIRLRLPRIGAGAA